MVGTPLLMQALQESEQMSLAALSKHPGYFALEKLLMEACKQATDDVIKLKPDEEGYEKRLAFLQTRARDFNEFSLLVLGSISFHTTVNDLNQAKNKPEEPQQNPILRTMNDYERRTNAGNPQD